MKKFKALLATVALLVGVLVAPTPAYATLADSQIVIGATWQPSEYTTRQPHYPKSEVIRIFVPAGSGCPSWSDSRVTFALSHGIIPFVSFKDYNTTCVVNWTNQAAGRKSYITWFHEGEANMTADTWKTRQNAMWNAMRLLPNHTNGLTKYMSVATRQWTENNGRLYDTYWCGCGDYFAVDAYVNSWESSYPTGAVFMSKMLAFAKKVGKPLFLPELGAQRKPSDTTGQGRKNWLYQSMVVAEQNPGWVVGVIYWDTLGTGGIKLALTSQGATGGESWSTPEYTYWNYLIGIW